MPASESPPPSLRGIMFVLFLMFLCVAAPIAIVLWLVFVLPWQFSAGVAVGFVLRALLRPSTK
jgi:hypothetical protein